MKTLGKQYAIKCAINNLRLGIRRSYFMDWATASGYSKNTAANYWQTAKKNINPIKNYRRI